MMSLKEKATALYIQAAFSFSVLLMLGDDIVD